MLQVYIAVIENKGLWFLPQIDAEKDNRNNYNIYARAIVLEEICAVVKYKTARQYYIPYTTNK